MGKIKKSKRARAKTDNGGDTTIDDKPIGTHAFLPAAFSNVLPKDFDLASVRSLKSMKNKFGIKKQITKTEKLKLRKEILKQKMDIVMESNETYPKSVKSSITKKPKKGKAKKQTELSENYSEGFIGKFNNVIDQDEEYLKLGHKNISVPKRKKRRQLMLNNISSLKSLMSNVNRKNKK